MHCKKCGKLVEIDAKFCIYCGEILRKSTSSKTRIDGSHSSHNKLDSEIKIRKRAHIHTIIWISAIIFISIEAFYLGISYCEKYEFLNLFIIIPLIIFLLSFFYPKPWFFATITVIILYSAVFIGVVQGRIEERLTPGGYSMNSIVMLIVALIGSIVGELRLIRSYKKENEEKSRSTNYSPILRKIIKTLIFVFLLCLPFHVFLFYPIPKVINPRPVISSIIKGNDWGAYIGNWRLDRNDIISSLKDYNSNHQNFLNSFPPVIKDFFRIDKLGELKFDIREESDTKSGESKFNLFVKDNSSLKYTDKEGVIFDTKRGKFIRFILRLSSEYEIGVEFRRKNETLRVDIYIPYYASNFYPFDNSNRRGSRDGGRIILYSIRCINLK